jgi:hypothetical protein
MGDTVDFESSAHANTGRGGDDPTTATSVDSCNSILVTHRRLRCHPFDSKVTVIANATTLMLVILARNTHDLRP